MFLFLSVFLTFFLFVRSVCLSVCFPFCVLFVLSFSRSFCLISFILLFSCLYFCCLYVCLSPFSVFINCFFVCLSGIYTYIRGVDCFRSFLQFLYRVPFFSLVWCSPVFVFLSSTLLCVLQLCICVRIDFVTSLIICSSSVSLFRSSLFLWLLNISLLLS